MPLIDDRDDMVETVEQWLRDNPPLTNAALRARLDTLQIRADALENLVGYTSHRDDCQIMTHGVWSDPIPCTCGLTALLEEIGGE